MRVCVWQVSVYVGGGVRVCVWVKDEKGFTHKLRSINYV